MVEKWQLVGGPWWWGPTPMVQPAQWLIRHRRGHQVAWCNYRCSEFNGEFVWRQSTECQRVQILHWVNSCWSSSATLSTLKHVTVSSGNMFRMRLWQTALHSLPIIDLFRRPDSMSTMHTIHSRYCSLSVIQTVLWQTLPSSCTLRPWLSYSCFGMCCKP